MLKQIKQAVKKLLGRGRVEPRNDHYVQQLMKASGWSHDQASKTLYRAKQSLGIRYTDFIRHELYKAPNGDYAAAWKAIQEGQQREAAELDAVIPLVASAMGWEADFIRGKLMEARDRLGCSWEEYCSLALYERNKEEQAALLAAHRNQQTAQEEQSV